MQPRNIYMRSILFLAILLPYACFASADIRERYVNAVEDFSTCGVALMPWGTNAWQYDEAERPYVEQAKINQSKMESEIDEKFYTEANLQKLFVDLIDNFYKETSELTAQLKKLPSDDHDLIWDRLFNLEKEAVFVREKLASDFRLHAEIIRMCSSG